MNATDTKADATEFDRLADLIDELEEGDDIAVDFTARAAHGDPRARVSGTYRNGSHTSRDSDGRVRFWFTDNGSKYTVVCRTSNPDHVSLFKRGANAPRRDNTMLNQNGEATVRRP